MRMGKLLLAFSALANMAAQSSDPVQAPAASATRPAPPAGDLQYANKTYLAYVRTSSGAVNSTARAGLEALRGALMLKTAVEPAGVAELDVETSEIALFPFLYWPVTGNARPLSEAAQKKVQTYIDTGGLILFDTDSTDTTSLARMLGNVNIRQLGRLESGEHALKKSFYMMAGGLPGSSNYCRVWVDDPGPKGVESVSSVVIGQNCNWAGAWAGITRAPNTDQWTQAMRAGVQIAVYALTGGYKDDELQSRSLIERLKPQQP